MSNLPPALLDLVTKVLSGEASSDELVAQLDRSRQQVNGRGGNDRGSSASCSIGESSTPSGTLDMMTETEGATVDLGRQARCGFGEVIYGEGKSSELITRIIQTQHEAGQNAFVTRIDSDVAFRVRQVVGQARHNPVARTLHAPMGDRCEVVQPLAKEDLATTLHAAVVTAGSTDLPVAEEAIETLAWMKIPVARYEDIGVAGPQRLLAVVDQLRQASAIVVVAGMEGALPPVVAGHVSAPVFAVPTSVGYGSALNGLTPLMGMLCSCASNVSVVNIDAGFKGGYMAGVVLKQLIEVSQRLGR